MTWSPDGRQLAFARDSGPNAGVWALRPDGTGLRRITIAVDLGGIAWGPG